MNMVDVSKIASQLGKLGGAKTREKYGSKHFSQAGKLGMAKRWAGHKKKKEESDSR